MKSCCLLFILNQALVSFIDGLWFSLCEKQCIINRYVPFFPGPSSFCRL